MGVINDYLPRGGRRLLAVKFKVSEQFVGMVINRKKYHHEILLYALRLAKNEKKRREKRDREVLIQIKKLVS